MEEIKIKTDDGYDIILSKNHFWSTYVFIIFENIILEQTLGNLNSYLPCPVYKYKDNAEKELERLNAPKIKKGSYVYYFGTLWLVDIEEEEGRYNFKNVIEGHERNFVLSDSMEVLSNEEVIEYLQNLGWKKGIRFDYMGSTFTLADIEVIETGVILMARNGYACHFDQCKIHEITQVEAFAKLVNKAKSINQSSPRSTDNNFHYVVDCNIDTNNLFIAQSSMYRNPIMFDSKAKAETCLKDNLDLWKAYYGIK